MRLARRYAAVIADHIRDDILVRPSQPEDLGGIHEIIGMLVLAKIVGSLSSRVAFAVSAAVIQKFLSEKMPIVESAAPAGGGEAGFSGTPVCVNTRDPFPATLSNNPLVAEKWV